MAKKKTGDGSTTCSQVVRKYKDYEFYNEVCGNQKDPHQKQCRICSYRQMVATKEKKKPPFVPTLFLRLADYWPQQWADSWTWSLLTGEERWKYQFVYCPDILKKAIKNHLSNEYHRELSDKQYHEFMSSLQVGQIGDESTKFLEYFECDFEEFKLAMRFTFEHKAPFIGFVVTLEFLAPSGAVVGTWNLNDLIDRKTWDEQMRLFAGGLDRLTAKKEAENAAKDKPQQPE